MSREALITFPSVSEAEANKLAGSLVPVLRSTDRNLLIEKRTTNSEAQDGGATLAIILGSAAVSAIAKGIATWLAQHSGTMIEIRRPDGTSISVKYASGRDTAETVAAALTDTGH